MQLPSRLQGNDGPIIEPAASQLVKSLLCGVKSRLVCRDSFQLTTTMNVTWTRTLEHSKMILLTDISKYSGPVEPEGHWGQIPGAF